MKKVLFTFALVCCISLVASAQDFDVTFNVLTYNGGYNISCNGASNGNIETIFVNGNPPFSYSWSNGAYTKDLHNIPAGTYTFTITDATNVTVTKSIELHQPDAITATLKPAQYKGGYNISQQGGSDGNISVSVLGGTPPYTYLWSTGSTKQEINNLAAGNYSLIVNDMNQCATNQNITLTEPTPFHIVSVTSPLLNNGYNVSCQDCNNGSADVVVTGGAPDYQYQWETGQFTSHVEGLHAGTYSVRVRDANGVEVIGSVTLTYPPQAGSILGTSDSTDVVFQTNSAERVRIGSNGDVKINSLSNNRMGLVFATTTGTLTTHATAFCTTQSSILPWVLGGNVFTPADDPSLEFLGTCSQTDLSIGTDGSENIKIKTNGKVGIGTSNPRQSLEVNGKIYLSDGVIQKGGNAITSTGDLGLYSLDPNSWMRFVTFNKPIRFFSDPTVQHPEGTTPNFDIEPNGNIGIGTDNPTTSYSNVFDPSKIVHIKGENPKLHLEDDIAFSGSPEPEDFEIQAANGAGRLVSSGGCAIFLNSLNNAPANDVFFSVVKNETYFSSSYPSHELFRVNSDGIASARGIMVTLSNLPDYVFDKGYSLKSLKELEEYINTNKHLPEIPAAAEAKQDGVNVGDMQEKLLAKIEELTLYVIDLQKQIEELKKK